MDTNTEHSALFTNPEDFTPEHQREIHATLTKLFNDTGFTAQDLKFVDEALDIKEDFSEWLYAQAEEYRRLAQKYTEWADEFESKAKELSD